MTIDSSRDLSSFYKFYIFLSQPFTLQKYTSHMSNKMQGSKAKTILIVDDDLLSAKVMQAPLKNSGFLTLLLSDSRKTIEVLKNNSVDLVILDIEMPHLSGLEVLSMLRKNFPRLALPVIMMSSHQDTETIVKALEQGANDYLTKPINNKVALARINTALQIQDFHKLQLVHKEVSALNDIICTYNHEINNPLMVATTSLELGGIEGATKALYRIARIVKDIGKITTSPVQRKNYLENGSKLIKIDSTD